MKRSPALLLGLLVQFSVALGQDLPRIEASRPDRPELYVLAAGLHTREDVFKNDAQSMVDLLDRIWGSASRSVVLIADDSTKDTAAYPTRDNLMAAARALGRALDRDKDVLVVFLSSHGSRQGLEIMLPGESATMLTREDLWRLLLATRAKHRVVIISACHSGHFLDELSDPNTMAAAAAHASRKSFGCSYRYVHTWFTQALMESLIDEPQFERALHAAAGRVEQRELADEVAEHSLPQIHVGAAIRPRLAEIERRAQKVALWEPPILRTNIGKVRQLLGDYVATSAEAGRDPNVFWLQLRKVAAPKDGKYPISAWGQLAYKSAGTFEALYDFAAGTLTASSPSLGELRLTWDGRNLVGETLRFNRAERREVHEIRGKHPPARLRAHASSVIRLVYLSAEDCRFCAAWERDHVQGGRLTGMPEFKQIEFVKAQRRSLKDKLRKEDLPESLAPLFDTLSKAKGYERLLTHVPAFVLLVDDHIRLWHVGAFLDSPVYPILRAAAREKQNP